MEKLKYIKSWIDVWSVQLFFVPLQKKVNMALYREQLEPHMHTEKYRRHKSYKWAKKQMNKFLRIKNKKIKDDDCGGYGKKQWLGWEF